MARFRINKPNGPELHNQFSPVYQVLKAGFGSTNDELDLGQVTFLSPLLGQLPQGASSAIRYPIAEISTNIFDHSKREVGWIFGQHYPSKGYLDIYILDRGRGFAKCYADEVALVVDDATAIRMVLEGTSAKHSDERGFGVWTTKRVVVEGMGGQCFILSGSAGYIASPKLETSFTLDGVNWPGVIVAFRIPNISRPIDIYPFVG